MEFDYWSYKLFVNASLYFSFKNHFLITPKNFEELV